jgi:hypothetical protein
MRWGFYDGWAAAQSVSSGAIFGLNLEARKDNADALSCQRSAESAVVLFGTLKLLGSGAE